MVGIHTVLSFDNCAFYHCEEAVQMIQEVGAIVYFLPPYLPDFNLIEEPFLKSRVK